MLIVQTNKTQELSILKGKSIFVLVLLMFFVEYFYSSSRGDDLTTEIFLNLTPAVIRPKTPSPEKHEHTHTRSKHAHLAVEERLYVPPTSMPPRLLCTDKYRVFCQ